MNVEQEKEEEKLSPSKQYETQEEKENKMSNCLSWIGS